MQRIEKDTFLRGFKVLSNQSFDLFLGAGASISSGIHSGSDAVLVNHSFCSQISCKANAELSLLKLC
jgi:hypothetical protein